MAFLLSTRDQYGGLVAFDRWTTIVNDPGLAVDVLDRPEFAIAGNFLNERISAAEVAEVSAARRHLNPGLRAGVVQQAGSIAAARVAGRFDDVASRSSPFDPVPELEALISGVVADYYFGDDGASVASTIARLLGALSRVFGNPMALPAWVPSPDNLRIRRRYRDVRQAIDPLVQVRLRGDAGRDYVAGVAQAAALDGVGTRRIAHLVIGSLLAAQTVPAAAAAWTLTHLIEAPVLERVRSGSLPLRAVILEATRLHPPTWLIRRTALAPVELGGHRFEAGHGFLVSPYVLHRDERCFDRAAEFIPERWLGGAPASSRNLLTFGRGIHRCPGRDLGLVLVDSVLQEMVRRYDIHASAGPVIANPRTTLLPDGFMIRLSKRQGVAQAVDASDRRFSTR